MTPLSNALVSAEGVPVFPGAALATGSITQLFSTEGAPSLMTATTPAAFASVLGVCSVCSEPAKAPIAPPTVPCAAPTEISATVGCTPSRGLGIAQRAVPPSTQPAPMTESTVVSDDHPPAESVIAEVPDAIRALAVVMMPVPVQIVPDASVPTVAASQSFPAISPTIFQTKPAVAPVVELPLHNLDQPFAASTPTTAVSVPAVQPITAAPNVTTPIVTAPHAAAPVTPVPVAINTVPAAPVAHTPDAVQPTVPEKIAVTAHVVSAAPERIIDSPASFKFLVAQNQSDTSHENSRGIGNAKSPFDMHASASTTTLKPAVSESSDSKPGFEFASSALSAPSTSSPIQYSSAPVTTSVPASVEPAAHAMHVSQPAPFSHAEPTVRREISLPSTDAAEVVHEVVELSHEFRARERSSVEVKFNFQGNDTELSVRLTYRDGDVHTTFRTDSADLRAALGREWQGYVAAAAQEPRGFRIADPVFTSSQDFSSGRDTNAFTQGDARQQSRQDAPSDESGANTSRHSLPGDAPHSRFSSSTPVRTDVARLPADRLLHAFA